MSEPRLQESQVQGACVYRTFREAVKASFTASFHLPKTGWYYYPTLEAAVLAMDELEVNTTIYDIKGHPYSEDAVWKVRNEC